jgi:hypothetical protein
MTVVIIGADNSAQQAIFAQLGLYFFGRGTGALKIVLVIVPAQCVAFIAIIIIIIVVQLHGLTIHWNHNRHA